MVTLQPKRLNLAMETDSSHEKKLTLQAKLASLAGIL